MWAQRQVCTRSLLQILKFESIVRMRAGLKVAIRVGHEDQNSTCLAQRYTCMRSLPPVEAVRSSAPSGPKKFAISRTERMVTSAEIFFGGAVKKEVHYD